MITKQLTEAQIVYLRGGMPALKAWELSPQRSGDPPAVTAESIF